MAALWLQSWYAFGTGIDVSAKQLCALFKLSIPEQKFLLLLKGSGWDPSTIMLSVSAQGTLLSMGEKAHMPGLVSILYCAQKKNGKEIKRGNLCDMFDSELNLLSIGRVKAIAMLVLCTVCTNLHSMQTMCGMIRTMCSNTPVVEVWKLLLAPKPELQFMMENVMKRLCKSELIAQNMLDSLSDGRVLCVTSRNGRSDCQVNIPLMSGRSGISVAFSTADAANTCCGQHEQQLRIAQKAQWTQIDNAFPECGQFLKRLWNHRELSTDLTWATELSVEVKKAKAAPKK